MSDPVRPTLRVVDPVEPPPPPSRRRGPGIAVIVILVYALLFIGALWVFKKPSRAASPAPRAAPAPPVSRASLLEGSGLAGVARTRYLARIGSEHCDCGCELTLHDCLARDRSCVRSPELAQQRLLPAAP